MIRQRLVVLAIVIAAAGFARHARAVTVFNDTFATSTLNAGAPAVPTGSSTDYAVLSNKNATSSSIGPGSMRMRIAVTSSGANEIQARFRATPLTLALEGDFLELAVTFVPNGIVYSSATAGGSLGIGLYNSGGTTPVTGGAMSNGQLGVEPNIEFATGFAAGWQGYATKFLAASGELFTRPPQVDTTNESQDLVFHNGFTGGFDTPDRSSLPGLASGLTLTNGSTYTYAFKITMAAGGLLDLAHNVYEGAGTGGTNIFTHAGQTTAEQTIATQFDGLALGYRATNDTTIPVTEHVLDISRIAIDTNLAVPTEDADFDNDNDVDGADFITWQQGLGGAGSSNMTGDANGSGAVDAADLGIWKTEFATPQSVGAAASVPEPAAAALAALAIAAFARQRRTAAGAM
jgi:hypothetical protein